MEDFCQFDLRLTKNKYRGSFVSVNAYTQFILVRLKI